MKTLSQILEESAKVRAEKQEAENTAERVGGILCDLTDFLQNKTALTGINVRTDANGVSIEVRAQTGDGQEASTVLVFPEATETQAGILSAALLQELRAGIDGNRYAIDNLGGELQESITRIGALESKTTYNGDNITKLFTSAQSHDKKIAAAEGAISAAQTSIHENSNNIKNLLAVSDTHDTRLALHGTKIEEAQARLVEHRTEINAAKTDISAAQASIQENANNIAAAKTEISAAKENLQYQSWRIDTLHKASDKQDLDIQKNRNNIAEVKSKLDEYPSQFVLDLGTVSSQEEGESRAASSEVAGNRNISFIRFQTQGVSNLKTTLILQYPNGENYTAQIKFVDKAQWRRNVTGATGVKGAATTATQWERTAPHYLGYDAANRKIQFKDYTQTVSREVQLPLVSDSSAGLLSPYMLSILEEMLEKIGRYADDFDENPVADSGNISGTPRNGLMSSSALAKLENYPAYPFDISEVTEQQNGLMTSADKKKLDAYPSEPLKIPLATASTAGLLSNADYQKIQWLISERDRLSNAINDIDTRLSALENK